MNTLARILFGQEWAVFTNGKFGFEVRPRLIILLPFALLLGAFIYYIRPQTRINTFTRTVLLVLRTMLILLIGFLLLRPVVVVSSVIPMSSHVAVLVDDSLSMKLRDLPGGQSRLEGVKQALFDSPGVQQQSFISRLGTKFETDLYGFSHKPVGLKSAADLYGEGRSSDLAGALDEITVRTAGVPLSAIVIASDGAANVPHDLARTLRELRARDIPVFTIGAGNAAKGMDAELTRASMPRRVLVGSRVMVEALVSLTGYGATKVLMAVREDGRAIKTEEFNLHGNQTQPVTLELAPAVSGWHRYTIEITPLDGELTVENNKQDLLTEVVDGPLRVLYVEGEPRWELGKIRESLQLSEKNVTLVTLQRTGENKFYRQGIASQTELGTGFPKTEEELFSYQGLILGSVEAAFFTTEQLRSLEAFVSRRGGGLLATGGRLAFDGGKYNGTPVADLLPVSLDGHTPNVADSYAPIFKPQLTAAGQSHPITRLNDDRTLSQKTWNEIPSVSISEIFSSVKPGATILLEGRRAGGTGSPPAQNVPLLVQQRYGRGQTLALTASDTWRWRMRMDSKNDAHETFWRQTLRYLVSGSPNQTEVRTDQDVYALDDNVRIVADIRDKRFNTVSDAHALAQVTKPSGATLDVPLKFSPLNDVNTYTGDFKADELGQYRIELKGSSTSTGQVSAGSNVLVSDLNREFYSAAQNSDLLKRIAVETGGKFYTPAEVQSLLDDLTFRRTPYSEPVTKELWDMPINFFLIIGLLSAEWFTRKRQGLA